MKYQKIKNGTFCPEGHQGDKSTIWNSEVYIYIYTSTLYQQTLCEIMKGTDTVVKFRIKKWTFVYMQTVRWRC
jgi:hypothetical protein